MDPFALFGRKSGNRCPDCGELLVPEEKAGEKGLISQSAWDSIYQLVFLVRRPRWVCVNKNCKSYFQKTNHKFAKNLLGTKMVDEHFLDDAMRKSRKVKSGINNIFKF